MFMIWNPFKKRFKMLWKIEKDKTTSYLAGCAHFFPVSYRLSLKEIIKELDAVVFEGPLDEGNMDAIRGYSIVPEGSKNIKEMIDKDIVRAMENEIKAFYYKNTVQDYINILKPERSSMLQREIEGLSPWMAFFRIWCIFLKNRGWHYSVDIEAHSIAKRLKKDIYYLETIEEQISALEAIPIEKIVHFISLFYKWEDFAKNHARYYKTGQIEKLLNSTLDFPTRYPSIIEERDPILYSRMRPFIEKGKTIVFVGITHIKGLSLFFQRDGFVVSKLS